MGLSPSNSMLEPFVEAEESKIRWPLWTSQLLRCGEILWARRNGLFAHEARGWEE